MNRLKELRRQKGINQGQIAELLHITQGAVSQWELGRTNMDYQYAKALAEYFNVSVPYLMGETNTLELHHAAAKSGVRIPVLGTIRAGIPVAAIEDIDDWEEIDAALAKTGEFVALRVKGDSMEPQIKDGDIAIIRRQETIESGQIAAVIVNGDEATIKKIRLLPDGMLLIGYNTDVYEPHPYTRNEIEDLPVRIYGRLVEVRRKF